MVLIMGRRENGQEVGSLFCLFTHFEDHVARRHRSCERLIDLTRVGHVTPRWAESVTAGTARGGSSSKKYLVNESSEVPHIVS